MCTELFATGWIRNVSWGFALGPKSQMDSAHLDQSYTVFRKYYFWQNVVIIRKPKIKNIYKTGQGYYETSDSQSQQYTKISNHNIE